MQMIEHKLFPTLVGKFENVLFVDQCNDLISSINNTSFKKYGAFTGNAVTSFYEPFIVNELPEHIRFNILSKIEICINQYVKTYGCGPVTIQNTWISYQYPNSKLKKHTHPGSSISGVLYLKTDEKSSPLYFYNPNPFATFTTIDNQDNPFTRSHERFVPKTGDLLLFPSWLSHGSDVEENMSEERIIFSFNTREL